MHPLVLEDICFNYPDRSMLSKITAHFPQGSLTGIIGPNGSGKTTLVKVIGRWLAAESGTIKLFGQYAPTLSSRHFARALAVVEQESLLGVDLTVRELVSLGRLPHQTILQRETLDDRSIILRSMSRTGIVHLSERAVSQLSGGEKQRARIAMALAQDSPILILDEPTTHLDIRHQMELLALLLSLANEGMTIIAVLHDINLAALYCQRLVVMSEGKIFAQGSPLEILNAELISSVYGCRVETFPHPTAGIPQISLLPL